MTQNYKTGKFQENVDGESCQSKYVSIQNPCICIKLRAYGNPGLHGDRDFYTLDCVFPENIVLSPEPLNPPVSVNNNTCIPVGHLNTCVLLICEKKLKWKMPHPTFCDVLYRTFTQALITPKGFARAYLMHSTYRMCEIFHNLYLLFSSNAP